MGLGKRGGGPERVVEIRWLAYHSPGSWPISEATLSVSAMRAPIKSVKALASV